MYLQCGLPILIWIGCCETSKIRTNYITIMIFIFHVIFTPFLFTYRTKTKEQNSSLLISDFGSSEPVKNHQKPVVPQPTTSSSSAAQQQSTATSSLEENILLDFGMTSSVSGAACTQSVKASKEDMMKDDLPILG